jgi:pimeloyl-[acyl-carrier protein] methyl ester esterase
MSLHVESVGIGPPLVLLHGWGLHGGIFTPLLLSLAQRHRVHVVDLPGHGHSASIARWTLDAVVDSVIDSLDTRVDAGAPLAILGWSFGGTVAQRFAARHPQRIACLALVCTTPRFVSSADWPHGVAPRVLEQFGDELRVAYVPTIRRFLSLQMQNVADARSTLALMRKQLETRPPADPAALAGALAILESADLRDAAPALAMPALVVTGGRDTLTPAGAGAWLADAMPDARLAPIAEAAHIPFLSHPAEFTAAVAPFLDAHTA